MKNKIVSKAYAKAMIDLATSNKVDIVKELTELNELINKSNELENILFLQVFSAEEKIEILNEVIKKGSLSVILKSFLSFLVQEGRIGLFPSIYKEIIVEDNYRRGFLKGTIEGIDETITKEAKNQLLQYLEKETSKKIDLSYVQNKQMVAGYRVTVEDLQLDASIEKQLETFKEQVLND